MTASAPDLIYFDETAEPVVLGPGRARIRFPRLYGSEQMKNAIEEALSKKAWISEVYANPLTGKVLISFDAAVSSGEMLARLGIRPPVAPVKAPANRGETSSRRSLAASSHAMPRKSAKEAQGRSTWHAMESDAVLSCFGSGYAGVSSEIAGQRLKHGLNVLPEKEKQPAYELFLSQLKGTPAALLGLSAVLSLLTGGIAEAVAIVAVLGLNAGIGYSTERRAEETIASLSELVDETVPVIRDGKTTEVASSHVVIGDLLVLSAGVNVAADARLIEAGGLLADESALTGESHFVSKTVAPLPHAVPLADRSNMVYMGTAIAAGRGLAVVTATGASTELGLVQILVTSVEPPRTPIQKQLDSLGNRLVMISMAACGAVFLIGLLRGRGMLEMFRSSISLAVAAVPEGLPTVATTSFSRGLQVMKNKEMLIRRLQTVETLGAIHTVCFDKTGTLTLNQMSVVALRTLSQAYGGYDGKLLMLGEEPEGTLGRDVGQILNICILSNENGEAREADSASLLNGSSTENALVRFAADAGLSVSAVREQYPRLKTELRAEKRNYMTTVHSIRETGKRLVTVKGSPLEVLDLCRFAYKEDELVPLTKSLRALINDQNAVMAKKQLRVLGFACAEAPTGKPMPDARKLIWLGLVGMADPIRPDIDKVIAEFHRAGVRTVMITGDQRATAQAIGECLKIAKDSDEVRVLDSERLDGIEPAALSQLVAETDVFARVSPERKLWIIKALQESGKVVAMIGDGINDGPALRASDIGIAMGLKGTNLARSSADVVLKDDRLETVLDAICQGRTITQNIEKSLDFLISSNLSEILTVLGSVSLTGATPLTPMQLLWINLLSDVLPAVALATEPPEGNLMDQFPRDPDSPFVGNESLLRYGQEGTWLAGGALGSYLYGLARHGQGTLSSGMAFNTLMLGQLLHALTCRSRKSKAEPDQTGATSSMLNLAVGGSIGLQLAANIVPALRSLLGIGRGMGLADMAVMLAGAGIPYLVNEVARRSPMKSGLAR